MNKIKFTLLALLLAVTGINCFAGTSRYYFKVTATATPTAGGLVYASSTEEPTDESYAEESVTTFNGTSADSYCNLYAKANEGYIFRGWATSADAADLISTEAHFQPEMTSSSTTEATPTEFNYYAIFAVPGSPNLFYENKHVYINAGESTDNNLVKENLSGSVAYTSSNDKVATVDEEGNVQGVGAGSATITASYEELSTSFVVTVIVLPNAEEPQLLNGDFEQWTFDGNNLPNNWNSFQTSDGALASMGYSSSNRQVEMTEDVHAGSNGYYSVRIWSRNVLSVIAQGNLTTGRVHAGSMSASDANNYNYSDRDGENVIDGVSNPCAMKFEGRPTEISFWVKFNQTTTDEENPNAHMAAIIHDDYDYITYGSPSFDNEENMSHVVAKAEYDFPKTDGEWVNVKVPFIYNENEVESKYIIINFSTNATPGKGKVGDELFIDDVQMHYDGEYITTGITNAPTMTKAGAVYNLQGQRVENNAHGILIVNGKKFFRK